ncbi:MAG TPA: SGNH/GDSL hydrolase family protein [Candidatus Saccharimonadales bacterium]|nr:SGNH/GDSL hydrolase family protein [Candidatus Saccharimonadales bacterium]
MIRFTHLARLFTAAVATTTLTIGLLAAPAASALGNSGSLNPITSGLWSGANFAVQPTVTTPAPQPKPVPKPTPKPATGKYAALGDSVAAGVGLPAASSTDDPRCGRSSQAYAYKVAQVTGLTLTHAACSGATVGDLVSKQRVDGPNIAAQLDTAFAGGVPKVITITAGANDVHWLDIIKTCYATNCNNANVRGSFDLAQYAVTAKYAAALAYTQWLSRGATPPKIVITGYYNPLSNACASVIPQFTPAELTWISSAVAQMNNTLRNAASGYSNVTFAPVDFTGHDICSASPWVQGQSDPTPFHPNAAGQQAIATSVTRALGY